MTGDDDGAAEFRTMFIFNPPPEDPNGWGLTFEGFAEALRNREPDAFTEQWSGVFVGETLSFSFTTSAGEESEGLVGLEPNGVAVLGLHRHRSGGVRTLAARGRSLGKC